MDIQLGHVARRLAGRKITLDTTAAARDRIADWGWDPAYGARPLKRVIQQRVENPLAAKILAGDVRDGDHVTLDAAGNSLTFRVASATPPADAPPAPAGDGAGAAAADDSSDSAAGESGSDDAGGATGPAGKPARGKKPKSGKKEIIEGEIVDE